jgi:predicted ester cyclase
MYFGLSRLGGYREGSGKDFSFPALRHVQTLLLVDFDAIAQMYIFHCEDDHPG